MRYKVLGYAFIISIFAATVSLLYYQQTTGETQEYIDSVHRTSSILRDSEKTFQIRYSSSYQTLPGTSNEVGTVIVPKEMYAGTNFIEGKATVSKFENSTLADCGIYEKKKIEKHELIRGSDFYIIEFTGAAAGNRYESKVYRTMRGTTCYEVNLTLHTAEIGNYPEGSVVEVDKEQVWGRLESMLSTFTFTK